MIEGTARRPEARRPAADEPASSASTGRLRWVLGWIVLPGTIIAALFLSGVHVGARRPDRGLARVLLKISGGEPGVAAEPEPSSPSKPRPGAQAGAPFELEKKLQHKQLQAIADKSLGLDVSDLECEAVCRAAAKAEYEIAVYSVEHCELGLVVSVAPTTLKCRGKLEAVDGPNDKAPAR